MFISRKSPSFGFTLVEMLVVIAIIAILASIIFPVFAGAKENARKVSCINNQRQIALGIQIYSQDHGQYPGSDWMSAIGLNDDRIFVCPDCKTADDFFCTPAYAASQSVSYGMNSYLQNVKADTISRSMGIDLHRGFHQYLDHVRRLDPS